MRLLLLLLLLMGSFMPTSVNLRGHSAQFTIKCPPQTPTLPPPSNTDSVPGTSKVERHEQQQQKKKSKMGTGPETLEHVSAFHDVCLSAFLSVCPRCCCSPVVVAVVVLYARIGPDSMFLTFTIATCFSNFQMCSRNVQEPERLFA